MTDTASPNLPQTDPTTRRPGESEIAWTLRLHDRHAGSGLTEGDRQAVAVVDHAETERQLDEALRVNAELLQEQGRLRKLLALKDETIRQLRDSLTASDQYNESLHGELASARNTAVAA